MRWAVPFTLTAVFLTACQAGPVTSVSVNPDGSSQVSIGAVFTDEAAEAVAQSLPQLQEAIGVYASGPVQVVSEPGYVALTAPVDSSGLANSAPLSGVSAVTVQSGESTTLRVTLTQASKLEDAIRNATSSADDSAVLTPLLLENTQIRVQVSMPGSIEQSSQPSAEVDGSSATLVRSVDEGSGEWVLQSGVSSVNWVLITGLALILVGAAGAVVASARRRS